MAKTKQDTQEQAQDSAAAAETIATPPSGKTILTATSREELAEKFEELKASHTDATLACGAVGQSRDHTTYMMQVNIINKQKDNGNT